MPEIKRTFETDDDLFQRKRYAGFLKNLILSCDNYHRDDDVKAYTIALDSPWGTGKSIFLEKFESLLEQDCKDQIRVVHYNAWENDFWDNAFEPFADAVFSHPLFASPLADQTEGSAGEKFREALKHLSLAFAKKRLDDYFDSSEMMKALEAATSATKAATSQKPTIISPKYSAYKMSLQTVQDAMEKVLAESASGDSYKTVKLVIIIDELDRCRPTFAIETLEIAKHVMDVSNVVYLFALDMQQLGAAVKQIYGGDTDSIGYLMRFFSYYTHLPEAKKQYVVETIANKLDLQLQKSLTNSVQAIQDESGKIYRDATHKLKSEMVQVSDALGLSVRDLETIGKVYELMHNIFLKKYQNPCAYLLYWFLLCSKYKQPLLFDDWMNKNNSDIDYPVPSEQADALPSELLRQMEMLSSQDPMGHISFSIRESPYESYEPGDKIVIFSTDTNNTKVAVDYVEDNNTHEGFFTQTIDNQGDISGVLFLPDLLNWDKINQLTLKQYYSQQLEMYTFLSDIQ